MKIYDKKGFIENIAGFLLYISLTAIASFVQEGTPNFAPGTFILYMTVKRAYEAVSEEKSRINMEQRQQKARVMEKYFGKAGQIIDIAFTVAVYLSLVVMCFNFGAGIVMFLVTLVLKNIVLKSANEELRKINETANQQKNNINRNIQE
ncbi:MAG: hypothetical protein J6K80_05440 [Oscillospiraceae bacterium]|nr:hypothetical protein [Oscillospiraceae bacterium]